MSEGALGGQGRKGTTGTGTLRWPRCGRSGTPVDQRLVSERQGHDGGTREPCLRALCPCASTAHAGLATGSRPAGTGAVSRRVAQLSVFWGFDLSLAASSQEAARKQLYTVNTKPQPPADPGQITGPTNSPRSILTGNSKPRSSSV